MRSLPDRHFVTNPRKKTRIYWPPSWLRASMGCLFQLTFQVIYSSLDERSVPVIFISLERARMKESGDTICDKVRILHIFFLCIVL